MSRFTTLLIAGVLSLTVLTPACAISLRSETVITRDKVMLGDLFNDVSNPDQVIGPAPAPGKRGLYDAAYLLRLSEIYQLPWRPTSQFDRVVVTRASTAVHADAIHAALVEALRPEMRMDKIEVELDNHEMQVQVPQTVDPPQLSVDDLALDNTRTRFTGTLVARVAGADPVRVPVSGRVVGIMRIPVVNHSIGIGEVISDSDIDWIDMRSDRVFGSILTTEAQLVGMQPRHQLIPNQPLHPYDVHPQIFVNKGALVTLMVQTPYLSITAQGKAMEDGTKGQVIHVVNTSSNKSVEGIVTGMNVVSVSTPATVVTN